MPIQGGFESMDEGRRRFIGGRVREGGGVRPSSSLLADIGDACLARRQVECRICGEVCDASAIRFRPTLGGVSRPELDHAACTGCGACVAPCPAHAIACRPSATVFLEAP